MHEQFCNWVYYICLLLEKELSVEFGVYRDNGGVIFRFSFKSGSIISW